MWGNELAPELHSMTTSLSPPDVDAAIQLHAQYAGAHEGFGVNQRVRVTQLSKTGAGHGRDWVNPLAIQGARTPKKDFSQSPYLPQLENPIYPLSVVDPKYLTDALKINYPPKSSGVRRLTSVPGSSNEALLINERLLEPSTAVANSVYFPQEAVGLVPRLGRSARNEGLNIATVHNQATSPLLTPVPSIGLPLYKYGNDTSFGRNGFYAPPHHNSEEDITQSNLNLLQCLERRESSLSPLLERQAAQPVIHDDETDLGRVVSPSSTSGNGSEYGHSSDGARPSKRRKKSTKDRIKSQPEQNFFEHQPRQKKVSIKKTSRPQSDLSQARSSSDLWHLRNSKTSRQNLSSEQRRANHIGSEKQRRDSIQVLEEELRQVVPVLRSSDFSKAEMLEQAGSWLESLIQGNDILEAQLEECKT